MMKKFCWLPTKVYSSPYYRDGFSWFSCVYELGGKCYRDEPKKIRIRLDSDGYAVFTIKPNWCNYPSYNQFYETVVLKYSKKSALGGWIYG